MTASTIPVAAAPIARGVLVLGGLAAATVAGLVLAIAIGPVTVPLDDMVTVLFGGTPDDSRSSVLIGTVRVPRALTAAVAGAALGVAGLQLQTLFRNPLADPFVLGVSSGASLGVALTVVSVGSAGAAGGLFTGGLGVAGGRTGRVDGLRCRWPSGSAPRQVGSAPPNLNFD